MKVKIEILNENAVIPFKTYNEDFCYDVVAVSEEEVAPNVWKYGLGFALQIERGDELLKEDIMNTFNRPKWTGYTFNMRRCPLNLSIGLRPRSSVWKTGMVLSNCEGTVDEGYTGEISAIFYHVLPHMPRYTIGQKIAQMKIGATFPCDFIVVDKLSATSRNSNGYGSTGG